MDNVKNNNKMDEEIVILNEDFGITRDGVSLVTLSGRQISLQNLNGDISSIINFLQDNENHFIDEEFDIKPSKELLDERLKCFELSVKSNEKLIKTETVDIEEQIEYQSDELNETNGESSFVDCIQTEKFHIDTEVASCSKNYNEHKTKELNISDVKLEIEENNLPPKVESQIKSSQIKTNRFKGKSLLNSNKNVVKCSLKSRSLLKTNRNSIKTSDNENDTNKTICTKVKESTNQTETRKIETIDALPIASEIPRTNNVETAMGAEVTECSGQFKQIAHNINVIQFKYSLNSSTNRANTSMKHNTLLKPNKNSESNQIDKTNSKPEIQLETDNSDSQVVSKPTKCTYHTGLSQTEPTVDTKPKEQDHQISINTPESDISEITESDVQIVRNIIKGKSLLNSTKNVIKSSSKGRALLKSNQSIVNTSDNEIDTKKYTTTNTKLIQSNQSLKYNKGQKFELQIEPEDYCDTLASKTKKDTDQNGNSPTDTIDLKPTETELQIAAKKDDTPVCNKISESNVQIVRKTNPMKGKSLLNSTKSVVKSSRNSRSLLKPNNKSLVTTSNDQIDTNKSDTELAKPVIQAVTKMDPKPMNSKIQVETNNTVCTETPQSNVQIVRKTNSIKAKSLFNSNRTVVTSSRNPRSLLKCNNKSFVKTSNNKIDSKKFGLKLTRGTAIISKRNKIEIQIEKDYYRTMFSKPKEIMNQKVGTNQTDIAIDFKTSDSDLPIALNKSTEQILKKTNTEIIVGIEPTGSDQQELDKQKKRNISEVAVCSRQTDVDIDKETRKSDTLEDMKPVDRDLPKETNDFETVVGTKLVNVNKSETAVCTEVKVDMQKETKNSDEVIFKVPQIPIRKIIRKPNVDLKMRSKTTVGRNVSNCADRILFIKPKRAVSKTNIKRNILKDNSASAKVVNDEIVMDKSGQIKLNQAVCSKYSADTFIKKKLLKRKKLNLENVATGSKKPKLTGTYSAIIPTKSLDCDIQKPLTSDISIEDISTMKDNYLLDCTSPVEEWNNMSNFMETEINEQFLNQNMETNAISADDNILWSSGDDVEIIKRSSEVITVDSDTDSNYSVCSVYDDLVEQNLFVERPEGYPRIRVRTDLMPKSPNEVKRACGITVLRDSDGRYVYAVVNVKEFKKKYADRNLKLLLKKPNFRMDLHRVYRRIRKMVSEGTYTLDELKEYLIENVDKIMSEFEMHLSLKRKHKEFYESELEVTKDLAADLEIQKLIDEGNLERIKTEADVKKKSWCRVCQKEANIYCGAANYYCSVTCQNRERITFLGTQLSINTNITSPTKMEETEEVSPEEADEEVTSEGVVQDSGLKITEVWSLNEQETNVEVSPEEADYVGQDLQSSNSGLKITEVWSLNEQEENEVVTASKTGRLAVLKRHNYKNTTRKEKVNNVTRKRETRSKSSDDFSGETIAWNVPSTSSKDPPRLNIQRVCPSTNANTLKKMRCDLDDISKLNEPNNKLNLEKVNNVISHTEGTVNVPALIIDFPKNKPSNITNINKTPQKLILTNVQKQDGQLKSIPLHLYNFSTDSKVAMPHFILNNFKPQNKDIKTNAQTLHVAQPKSTSQHSQIRPNNQNPDLLMANMFETGNTGLNKQCSNNRTNTSVNNKNLPTQSLLLCKKTDMPSTSGIHRVVMAQDLEKPGPSGLNTKSIRSTNTVTYPKNPPCTFIRKPTANPTIRYPIKSTSTPTISYPTKPTSTPTVRYATKPTNITTKYPRKPTMNKQPILSLPTTTQPILSLPTSTRPVLQLPTNTRSILQLPTSTRPLLHLPTNYASNIRMPRPIINNTTNPRKLLPNNSRPMRPRFLFPKPTRPDNLNRSQIKTLPAVKTFVQTPNISQFQCINSNQTKINRATASNIIADKVTNIPGGVSPSISNVQSLPNLAETLILAKDNTYKLAVPSVRSDSSSKPVYIIKDLPP